MDAASLAALLDRAAEARAKSWQFLGGNPDSSVPGILAALSRTAGSLPVIWNTAMVLSPQAMKLLRGIVDVWVCDFKFGNDLCAENLAGCVGYMKAVRRNLESLRDDPRVVVRHTTIPGHNECCARRVRDIVTNEFPEFRYVEQPVHLESH